MQSSPLPTLEHEQFNSIQFDSIQFGEALMSDSPNFDASVTDPQAHGRIPGRLRENVTDLQAHGRLPGRRAEPQPFGGGPHGW